MFNPKVSIIIPVYNGSNYLAEAIDSALAQIYKNIEILVINDGSNDNGETEKVALSYGNKIRYIPKENGGVASALNLGIEKMNGEYFSWLSHDDLYYPNKVKDQIIFLNSLDNIETIVSTDISIINNIGDCIGEKRYSYDQSNIIYEMLFNGVINGCTLLIHKNIFRTIGTFKTNLKVTQDYDLRFRAIHKGYSFLHLNKTLVKSRVHNLQDTQKRTHLIIKEGKMLERSVFDNFSINTILPKGKNKTLKTAYIKFKLFIKRTPLFVLYITKKIGVYKFIFPVRRKYILKKNI